MLTLLLLMPLLLPLVIVYLSFLELRDKFIRCLNCGSKKLIIVEAGNTQTTSEAIDLSADQTQDTRDCRKAPAYKYYECAQCHSMYKKLFGEKLIAITEEEFATSKLSGNDTRHNHS